MAGTFKINLPECSINVFESSADAAIQLIYTPSSPSTGNPSDMVNALIDAQAQYPMGSIWPWGGVLQGVPSGNNSVFRAVVGTQAFQYHQLRVYEINPVAIGSQTHIMVRYKSRPRPSIEYDSSLTQRTVETYISNILPDGTYQRDQMKIGWVEPANYPTNILNTPVTYSNTPMSDNILRFGASIRVGATLYVDEITSSGLNTFLSVYSDSINATPLVLLNDTAMWLCANASVVSQDGGYSNRFLLEFVYNIDGWDSVGLYQDPITESAVLLDAGVLSKIYSPRLLSGDTGSNPTLPGPLQLNGASRFPQHRQISFSNILKVLLSNTPMKL